MQRQGLRRCRAAGALALAAGALGLLLRSTDLYVLPGGRAVGSQAFSGAGPLFCLSVKSSGERRHQRSAGVARRADVVDGVRYIPALDGGPVEELEATEGEMVLPCFPLDGVYLPHAEKQVLDIFEPRYRQMYSDILFSGGRRFVVPQARQDENGDVCLSEVGVVFYLDDLQEVSEQTDDHIKFVCSHSVISRVRIKRVLNPRVFATASTYLKVEVEEVVDADLEVDCSGEEERLLGLLAQVVDMLQKSESEVQINRDVLDCINATRIGLWSALNLWDSYVMGCLEQRRAQFQRDLEGKVETYIEGLNGEVPIEIDFDDFPLELKKELASLQQQFKEEVEPALEKMSNRMQRSIQSDRHADRLAIFLEMVEVEMKRLEAKNALKSLFD